MIDDNDLVILLAVKVVFVNSIVVTGDDDRFGKSDVGDDGSCEFYGSD